MRNTIILFFLFLHIPSFAQFAKIDEARTIANNFYSYSTNSDKNICTQEFEIKYNKQTVYYIFNFDTTGFVIVPACKSMYPIFAYSFRDKNHYIQEQSPEYLAVMEQYSKVVEYFNTSKIVNPDNQLKWDSIFYNKFSKSIFPSQDTFLIQTQWNQGETNSAEYPGYNAYVKENADCTDGHCTTGCGAVSIGQVMKFWNFGLINGLNYWDWKIMTYRLDDGPGAAQDEIARLLGQIGKDVLMSYCFLGVSCASFNTPVMMETALNNYGYEDAELLRRGTLSTFFWKQRIKNNLDAGYPVIYMGLADGINIAPNEEEGFGSHAFILDGYREDGFFHVNWGWGGADDAYYNINDLTPNHQDDNYNWFERVIVNIYPTEFNVGCIGELELDCNVDEDEFSFMLENRLNINSPIANWLYSADKYSFEECRTVYSDDNVRYKAYSQIRLQQGFKVENGGKFKASLTTCPETRETRASENLTKSATLEEEIENLSFFEIYPNPFTNIVTINYAGTENSETIIKIYNIFGQLQTTVLSETKEIGEYTLQYDLSNLSSGIYMCTMQNGKNIKSEKIVKTE